MFFQVSLSARSKARATLSLFIALLQKMLRPHCLLEYIQSHEILLILFFTSLQSSDLLVIYFLISFLMGFLNNFKKWELLFSATEYSENCLSISKKYLVKVCITLQNKFHTAGKKGNQHIQDQQRWKGCSFISIRPQRYFTWEGKTNIILLPGCFAECILPQL